MSLLTRTNKSMGRPDLREYWSKDLDSVFLDAMKRMGFTNGEIGSTHYRQWSPKVDISETDKEVRVRADLPGLSHDDIEITFQDNTLTIKGERELKREDEKEDYYCIETSYGHFQRNIPFDVKIDRDKIKADFKHGVLNIRMAKADDVVSSTRKIKIN